MSKQAFAFKTSFTTKLNTQAIGDYTEFLTSIGVPSESKMGVVFDIIHAYPLINGNGHAFTSDVIKNSYKSFLNSLIDINHERQYVAGTIVKVDLIEDGTSPATVRLVGVLDKEILRDWGIEDLINEDWSMECRFNQYSYSIGNKIYNPLDVPEIDAQFSEIAEGKAVYDKIGNRVVLLLGGTDGVVDFNRCGLIIWGSGADPLAETHLQVAHKKGGQEMPTYTEEQLNEKVTAAKQEVENAFQAKAAEYDGKIQELNTKVEEATTQLGEVQTALAAEKERADAAEAKLAEMETEKLVNERKQALASKGYPEDMIEEEKEFLAKASVEEFDRFVTRFEALVSKIKPTQTATASTAPVKTVVANLTGGGEEVESNGEETNELSYVV